MSSVPFLCILPARHKLPCSAWFLLCNCPGLHIINPTDPDRFLIHLPNPNSPGVLQQLTEIPHEMATEKTKQIDLPVSHGGPNGCKEQFDDRDDREDMLTGSQTDNCN